MPKQSTNPLAQARSEADAAASDAALHTGPLLDRTGEYDIIACECCGFAHVLPLPSDEALADLYMSDYYSDVKPDYLERAREDADWAQLSIDDKLEQLEAHLPPDRRRLLDIGSGPGFFLQRACERGWNAEGIDPSTQACAHARSLGLQVTEGFFSTATAQALGTFDAITLTNMLEHVPDPATLVRLAHQCLRPGGLICVTVPNDYNALQETLRSADGVAPWWLAPPHHLNYFNFDSLTLLLQKLGFQARARTTSFPMELFALMGDQYMGNPTLGRACHNKRVRWDMAFGRANNDASRRRFYEALAQAGMGREAIVIAQKA